MKKFIILISLVLGFGSPAIAAPAPTSFFARTVYSSTNVTTAAWHQLVASTPTPISAVTIFDSSGQTLEIGIGPSGSEVPYMLIPPGGGGFPLNLSQGYRVSIRAVSATAATGENDINFFSN